MIKSDFYEDIRWKLHILQQFDFSKSPPRHPLFCKMNKYIVQKFKYKFAIVSIQEFGAHKSKLYPVIAIEAFIFITIKHITTQLVNFDSS